MECPALACDQVSELRTVPLNLFLSRQSLMYQQLKVLLKACSRYSQTSEACIAKHPPGQERSRCRVGHGRSEEVARRCTKFLGHSAPSSPPCPTPSIDSRPPDPAPASSIPTRAFYSISRPLISFLRNATPFDKTNDTLLNLLINGAWTRFACRQHALRRRY